MTFTFIWVDGLPWWLSGKDPTCQHGRLGFVSWDEKIPWRRKWQPVFLPGESHGQREAGGIESLKLQSWSHLSMVDSHSCVSFRCPHSGSVTSIFIPSQILFPYRLFRSIE